MMLPEHVQMAKKVFREDLKTPRPFLNEDQILEMEQLLLESLQNKHYLHFHDFGMMAYLAKRREWS
ncbi:YolD-like family protein [Metabacillus sp. RGM 3146]|uniref:YolD-like family protein n=1 Tax=Metabacillus sp. RGM 3146 TaxID=3401092 RepID=UPI003B9C8C4B